MLSREKAMILTGHFRMKTAVLTFLFIMMASGSASAKKSKKKPRQQKVTCANVKCAPDFQCIEGKSLRCVPIPTPELPEPVPDVGNLKVRDLDLYGCINDGPRVLAGPFPRRPAPRARA